MPNASMLNTESHRGELAALPNPEVKAKDAEGIATERERQGRCRFGRAPGVRNTPTCNVNSGQFLFSNLGIFLFNDRTARI